MPPTWDDSTLREQPNRGELRRVECGGCGPHLYCLTCGSAICPHVVEAYAGGHTSIEFPPGDPELTITHEQYAAELDRSLAS